VIDESRSYDVGEAAPIVGIGVSTYYRAFRRGEVPGIKIGRRLVVPGMLLRRFLEGQPLGGAEGKATR